MGKLTAVTAQRLCRETARKLAEGKHTAAELEALLWPVSAAVAEGWGIVPSISCTGEDGKPVHLDMLERRLIDMLEAAIEAEAREERESRRTTRTHVDAR